MIPVNERTQIHRLRLAGKTIREIAEVVFRSPTSVTRVLRESPQKKFKRRRPGLIDNRMQRRILSIVQKDITNATYINAETGINCSTRTIQRFLNTKFSFKNVSKRIKLTDVHKSKRLEFAEEHAHWTDEWDSVIFSEEKKFTFAVPDGPIKAWIPHGEVKIIVPKGRKSVMVWAAFPRNQRSRIAIIKQNLKSTHYCKVLRRFLLPMISSSSAGDDFDIMDFRNEEEDDDDDIQVEDGVIFQQELLTSEDNKRLRRAKKLFRKSRDFWVCQTGHCQPNFKPCRTRKECRF